MSIDFLKNVNIHFIVAYPRTGSTLLSSMLNMHNNVLAINEQNFYFLLQPHYSKITTWTEKDIHQYCSDFYLFAHPSLQFQFGDEDMLFKTLNKNINTLDFELVVKLTYFCFFPEKDKNNISIIINKEIKMDDFFPQIRRLFPTSKFIFLYRNPLDNIARIQTMYQKNYSNRSVLSIAIEWNYRHQTILKNKQKLSSNQLLEIHYEDLIENSTDTLKQVTDFLEIPYDDKLLNYHIETSEKFSALKKEKNKWNTPQLIDDFIQLNHSISTELDTSKIALWKKELSQKEIAISWLICKETAKKIGYTDTITTQVAHKPISYLPTLFWLIMIRINITKLWLVAPLSFKRKIKRVRKNVLQKKSNNW